MSYQSDERNVTLSKQGKEIKRVKYTSVISENSRTIRKSKVELFKIKFNDFKEKSLFEKYINKVYDVKLDFKKPILDIKNDFEYQKSDKKRNYQIASIYLKPKKLQITIFNEGKNVLFWTTYNFKPTSFSKSLKFMYRESQQYITINEKLSPQGSILNHHFKSSFRKRFENFVIPTLDKIIRK